MGYRLEVREIKEKPYFYGTKLFGYFDPNILDSLKFLIEKKYLDDDVIFDYCFENMIIINANDFREFCRLYDADMKKVGIEYSLTENLEIQKMLSSNEDKILCWG